MLSFWYQTQGTAGYAAVGGMVESSETGSLTRPSLRVRDRQAGITALVERRQRRDVMAAARQAEQDRRQAARYAAAQAVEVEVEVEQPATLVEVLEQRYAALRQGQREYAATMRVEPNSSTAMAVRGSAVINGQEAKYTRRWQSSSRAYLASLTDERDQLLDWQCYSLQPDGTRRLVEVERKSSRKAKASSAKASRQATMRAAAGTIRMAEQD